MRWKTIDYSHAYFILPVSLWLVWRKRVQISELARSPVVVNNPVGLWLLLTGIALFIVGWRNDYLMVSTLSLIPVLLGMLVYLYGKAMARLLWFPVAYLLLLVPPPLGILDSITLPMRYGISVATAVALRSFHYPIYRHGLILSIDNSEIFMGQPCSGFRSLIAMISLGVVYVYLSHASFRKKIILALSVIPLALAGNFLRVTGMCLGTYYFGKDIGEKVHDVGGFVVFMLLILGMLAIEKMMDGAPDEN